MDVPEEVIAMASYMAVGVGCSGCLCGAVNDGVLALGMLFGRTEPLGPADSGVNHLMKLTNELHTWFRENNGKKSTCCRVLKTAEILCRELGIENMDTNPHR